MRALFITVALLVTAAAYSYAQEEETKQKLFPVSVISVEKKQFVMCKECDGFGYKIYDEAFNPLSPVKKTAGSSFPKSTFGKNEPKRTKNINYDYAHKIWCRKCNGAQSDGKIFLDYYAVIGANRIPVDSKLVVEKDNTVISPVYGDFFDIKPKRVIWAEIRISPEGNPTLWICGQHWNIQDLIEVKDVSIQVKNMMVPIPVKEMSNYYRHPLTALLGGKSYKGEYFEAIYPEDLTSEVPKKFRISGKVQHSDAELTKEQIAAYAEVLKLYKKIKQLQQQSQEKQYFPTQPL